MFSKRNLAMFGVLACLALNVCESFAGEIMLDLNSAHFFDGAKQGAAASDKAFKPGPSAAVFWRLDNIADGKYFLKMKLNCADINYQGGDLAPLLFLNGRALNLFDQESVPLDGSGGKMCVVQAAAPLEIKKGDVLRLNTRLNPLFHSLVISSASFQKLPLTICNYWPVKDDAYRIAGDFVWDQAAQPAFAFSIVNATGKASSLKVKCVILDYFQCQLGELVENVALEDWKKYSAKLDFNIAGTDRYKAAVVVENDKGNRSEAIFDVYRDNVTSFRKKMWLNDGWEWLSIADDGTLQTRVLGEPDALATAGWQKCDLPFTWSKKPSAAHHIGWFRKTFMIPPAIRGARYVLRFHRVATEGKIYLNGKKLFEGIKWTAAIDLDCTDALNLDGENILTVGARDQVAAMEQGDLGSSKLDSAWISRPVAPAAGKSGIGDVELLTTGQTYFSDIFVKTSVRQKALALQVTVANMQGRTGFHIASAVYQGGKEILRLKDIPCARGTAAGNDGSAVFNLDVPWENPPLWGPLEFPLLQLQTSLVADSGKLVDQVSTRFGFREIWADGMKLMWNGTPVRSACSGLGGLYLWSGSFNASGTKAQVRDGFREAKRLGFTMIRHCYEWDYQADMADEEGVMIACASSCPSGPTEWMLSCDKFWKNTEDYAGAMVLYQRNHPSIFTWYLSNEFLGASQEKNRSRLAALGKAVLKYDDSRFIEFGCDIDLGGFTPLISTHYPVDNRGIRKPDSLYLPEAFYWRRFDQPLARGMQVPCGLNKTAANVSFDSPITWGVKPVIINESCWDSFFAAPHGYTRMVSDEVYTGPGMALKCHVDTSRMFCRGHRDAEVAVINPWLGRNYGKEHVIPETDIIIPQQYHAFYCGAQVSFDVVLVCDRFTPTAADFKWSLSQAATGREIAGNKAKMPFAPCETKRAKIIFDVPEFAGETRMNLTAELSAGGKIIASEKRTFTAYPKSILKTCELRGGIAVYDPAGSSFDKIKQILPLARKADKPDKASLEGAAILIIGENQSAADLDRVAKSLLDFADKGGQIILLHQNDPQGWLPFPLFPGTRNESVNFSFRKSHPLLAGITADDLCYWYPGHKVVSNYFVKPDRGNAITIIEAGGPQGMIYAGMVEEPFGQGRIIATQMELLANLDQNPILMKFWKNLAALPSKPPAPPSAAGFLGDASSLTRKALVRTGVDFADIKTPEDISNFRTVIIGGKVKPGEAEIEKLKKFIADGGCVLFHGVEDSNKDAAGKIGGCEVKMGARPPDFWSSRAIRISEHPVLQGITHFDMLWKKYPGIDEGRAVYNKSRLDLGAIGKSTIACDKGQSLLYPAYLWVVENGKGLLVLDNLLWNADNAAINKISDRYLLALLNNLGVRFKVIKKRPIPEKLSYEPLDMSAVLNRAFEDEVAEDGAGGWTDQGKAQDFRAFPFPKGVATFKGVPFKINRPLGAAVLSCPARKALNPASVEIPVDKKADVIFFLHTSAYTPAGGIATYIINYADGSADNILMDGGINVGDFNSPDIQFPPNDSGTIAEVAWTGKTDSFAKFPVIALYKAACFPNPDLVIRSIVFKSLQTGGIPVLVAVTAGRKRNGDLEKKTVPQAAAVVKNVSKEEALGMARQYEALAKEPKPAQAAALLREIFASAPVFPEVYLNLAYVFENAKNWAGAIEVYEKLVAAQPAEMESYLRLGKCWEMLDEYAQAVKSYERGLEVDPNQPPLVAARSAAMGKVRQK